VTVTVTVTVTVALCKDNLEFKYARQALKIKINFRIKISGIII